MLRKIWYGFLILVGLLVWGIIGGFWFLTTPRTAEEIAAQEATEAKRAAQTELRKFKIMARASCSNRIKDNLRNPSSVDWDGRATWPVIEDAENLYTVIAKYRAENGFGGMVKETRQCLVARSGDRATVLGVE